MVNLVHGTFITSELEPAFATYVSGTLSPILERIGLERAPDEDEEVTLLRPTLLGALAHHCDDPSVIAFARAKSVAYLADQNSVESGLAGAALHIAASHGDAAFFDQCLERFRSTDVPVVRRQFLSTLGAFEDPALVSRALDLVTGGTLRPQELLAIPMSMPPGEAARERRWQWMTANYASLQEQMAPPHVPYLVWFAEGCSSERVAAAETFFSEPEHSPPGTAQQVKELKEVVGNCVRLREREGDSVAAYLRTLGRPTAVQSGSAASGPRGGAGAR
jgi:hypothetical protein